MPKLAAALPGKTPVLPRSVNISCPNIKDGGMAFGTDPQSAGEVFGCHQKTDEITVDCQTFSQCHRYCRHPPKRSRKTARISHLFDQHFARDADRSRSRGGPLLANTMGGLSGSGGCGRSRLEWSIRFIKPCVCRLSAWAGSAAGRMPWNLCWPGAASACGDGEFLLTLWRLWNHSRTGGVSGKRGTFGTRTGGLAHCKEGTDQ